MRLAAWGLALGLSGLPACNRAIPRATVAVGSTSPDAALARAVLDGSTVDADGATQALRQHGPRGLGALLDVYEAEVERARVQPKAGDDARLGRLRDALDRVARQKDAYASRLYWYTDLDEAKRAAKDAGRPILALRLLGNLDEDLSCANSRFFRTALYPDAQVSKTLRDGFVLYWSSERPAPVITIDFGDGRTIKRTVTGNSLHYVLDAEGRPVDAIPGLYGPAAFVRVVEAAGTIARTTAALEGRARDEALRAYHDAALRATEATWQEDLARSGVAARLARSMALPGLPAATGTPSAAQAAPIAMGKAMVERPVVNALVAMPAPGAALVADAVPWAVLARRHLADAKLDASSRRVMAAKNPMDWSAKPKPLVGAEFDAMVAGFELAMAADSVQNEVTRHAAIHRWFSREPGVLLRDLNRKVYSELFLTPASDPWLGLVPPLVYTGLDHDGFGGKP